MNCWPRPASKRAERFKKLTDRKLPAAAATGDPQRPHRGRPGRGARPADRPPAHAGSRAGRLAGLPAQPGTAPDRVALHAPDAHRADRDQGAGTDPPPARAEPDAGGHPGAQDLRPGHGLGCVPGRGDASACEAAGRGLEPPRQSASHPGRRDADPVRQPPDRPALPLRRGQEPDGRRPGQALALAGHAGQGPRLHVPGPQLPPRRFAGRPLAGPDRGLPLVARRPAGVRLRQPPPSGRRGDEEAAGDPHGRRVHQLREAERPARRGRRAARVPPLSGRCGPGRLLRRRHGLGQGAAAHRPEPHDPRLPERDDRHADAARPEARHRTAGLRVARAGAGSRTRFTGRSNSPRSSWRPGGRMARSTPGGRRDSTRWWATRRSWAVETIAEGNARGGIPRLADNAVTRNRREMPTSSPTSSAVRSTSCPTGGAFGLIATNTIGQGDTRSTGLRWICNHGGTIYAARKRLKWPGEAAVVVSVVHVHKGPMAGPFDLDGQTGRA